MELLRAAEVGNVHTLRHILQTGADVNYRHPQGKHTALHVASKHGRLSEVKVMVEAFGAQACLRDQDFNLPIHLAAASGHTHIVAYFIEAGIATATEWAMHWSLLHITAFEGHADTVRYLLHHGADPMLPGMHGRIPLHRAAYNDSRGAIACVTMLLDHGVDVNAPDDSGWTALHQACERGNCAVIKALLERGACLQEFDACSDGDTPLIMAARNGHVEAMELLLGSCGSADDRAVALQTVNFYRESALHKAVENAQLRAVEGLVAQPGMRAALEERNRHGRTALDVARDLHDVAAALTLQGAAWTPSSHSDYPYQFKVAVRTMLMVAAKGCREAETANAAAGHLDTAASGPWSLPPGVLHRIYAAMAFPLSGWHRCVGGGLTETSDSPADIIALNMSLSGSSSDAAPGDGRRASGTARDAGRGGGHAEAASPADIIWSNTVRSHYYSDATDITEGDWSRCLWHYGGERRSGDTT